jgi:hypothetical protein
MPCPSHSSRFYHSNNIQWAVQIIKLLSLSLSLYIYIYIYIYICVWGGESGCLSRTNEESWSGPAPGPSLRISGAILPLPKFYGMRTDNFTFTAHFWKPHSPFSTSDCSVMNVIFTLLTSFMRTRVGLWPRFVCYCSTLTLTYVFVFLMIS